LSIFALTKDMEEGMGRVQKIMMFGTSQVS
jgi:hypothetical protein